MTSSGQAYYFDGATSARHEVTVELAPAALKIHAADGSLIAEWPYAELEALSAPESARRRDARPSTSWSGNSNGRPHCHFRCESWWYAETTPTRSPCRAG